MNIVVHQVKKTSQHKYTEGLLGLDIVFNISPFKIYEQILNQTYFNILSYFHLILQSVTVLTILNIADMVPNKP